jgi:hypothetical protein
MILFKVNFTNNIAVSAIFTKPIKRVEWKEHPYRILSMEVYANNNVHALSKAQTKADELLKRHK